MEALFELPFMDLLYRAQQVHRAFHAPNRVQMSTLLSIKTGGCPEDCGYCPQSIHYETGVAREDMLPLDAVVDAARKAQAAGATRFCMGAAFRSPKKKDIERIAEMIREVGALGLETCATLGMLTPDQAQELKEAGLDYYNHNVDSSEEYLPQDHLDANLPASPRHARSGAQREPEGVQRRHRRDGRDAHRSRRHARDAGEPAGASAERAHQPAGPGARARRWRRARRATGRGRGWLRVCAHHCRRADPDARRRRCGCPQVVSRCPTNCRRWLCMAGANSIFYGEKLLTTGNPDVERDQSLLARLKVNAETQQQTDARGCC